MMSVSSSGTTATTYTPPNCSASSCFSCANKVRLGCTWCVDVGMCVLQEKCSNQCNVESCCDGFTKLTPTSVSDSLTMSSSSSSSSSVADSTIRTTRNGGGGEPSTSNNTAYIAVAAVAAVIVLLCVGVGMFFLVRRRTRQQGGKKSPPQQRKMNLSENRQQATSPSTTLIGNYGNITSLPTVGGATSSSALYGDLKTLPDSAPDTYVSVSGASSNGGGGGTMQSFHTAPSQYGGLVRQSSHYDASALIASNDVQLSPRQQQQQQQQQQQPQADPQMNGVAGYVGVRSTMSSSSFHTNVDASPHY
jgi:hypothetical protein